MEPFMVKFRALCSGSWGCWLGRAGPVLGLVAEDWASAESCRRHRVVVGLRGSLAAAASPGS